MAVPPSAMTGAGDVDGAALRAAGHQRRQDLHDHRALGAGLAFDRRRRGANLRRTHLAALITPRPLRHAEVPGPQPAGKKR